MISVQAERQQCSAAKKRGGIFPPLLCNFFGILILLSVIAFMIPVSLPGLFDWQLFSIDSGSMEPAIPVDSLVFVAEAEARYIEEGQVIAFYYQGDIFVHRVVENHVVEGVFITKGDANEEQDMNPVPYDDLIGTVNRSIPIVGAFYRLVQTVPGKIYILMLALCGVLLNVLASHLRSRRRRVILKQLSKDAQG